MVGSVAVQSGPTGGMPDTLASYRKRAAELTKSKANNSGWGWRRWVSLHV